MDVEKVLMWENYSADNLAVLNSVLRLALEREIS